MDCLARHGKSLSPDRYMRSLNLVKVLFAWSCFSLAAFGAAPTITSISPSAGATVGQTITITGRNYGTVSTTTVTFPNVAAAQTPATVTSTTITVVVPAG